LDNAFLPRVHATKGEGDGLKCGDDEKGLFFCERGKVEGVRIEEEKVVKRLNKGQAHKRDIPIFKKICNKNN